MAVVPAPTGVVELDEASWLAAEFGAGVGGTVSACRAPAGHCEELATGLPLPSAATASRGHVYAAIWSLVPGMAEVAKIPRSDLARCG